MVSSERGPAEPCSMNSRSRRRRDRDRRCAILQAQAKSHVLKRLLWHGPRDDFVGATGPAPSCYTGSKLSETAYWTVDNGTASLEWVDSGMGLRLSPVGAKTYTERGDPHGIVLACHTCSKWSDTVKLKGKIFARKKGNFDWMVVIWDLFLAWQRALPTRRTPNGRGDLQPFLLIRIVPSCCLSETANWNVDSESGSLESMGTDLDSISCLRRSCKGETAHTGRGDPPCAAPKCSELMGDRKSRGEYIRQWNGQLRFHGQRPRASLARE